MKQYLDALQFILDNGEDRSDRTGVGTRSVFGYQMRFDLADGFPAVTTKRLAWKSVVSELLWFLEGSTDERRLAEILYEADRTELTDRTTIWTANADAQGKQLGYVNTEFHKELGPVYGHQWRRFGSPTSYSAGYGSLRGVDQIQLVLDQIRDTPDSRRILLSSWNPTQISQMALPPCHTFVQFYVQGDRLSAQMYQRSADMFLGVPFNIASYALLVHMMAKYSGLKPGDFVHTIGDAHIYNTHRDVIAQQLQRTPGELPTLEIPDIISFDIVDIEDLSVSDFKLINYDPQSTLKAPRAV